MARAGLFLFAGEHSKYGSVNGRQLVSVPRLPSPLTTTLLLLLAPISGASAGTVNRILPAHPPPDDTLTRPRQRGRERGSHCGGHIVRH